MKMKYVILSSAFLGVLLISCGGETAVADHAKAYSENQEIVDSTLSSSAAIEDIHSNRKFVRTADLKFKVKDVRTATYAIEDVIAKNNGFVTHTNLASNISYVNTVSVSADSSKEITHFTVDNTIEIRVPNSRLDDALKQMSGLVEFLDYRNINADDVTLKMLANRLIQKRIAIHENRLDNASHVKAKLHETVDAENNLLQAEEQKDQAMVANLSIQDQVDFSTIKIYLYQRPSIKEELVASEKTIEPYEPPFYQKIGDALVVGLNTIEVVFLALISVWWLWVLVVVGYFGYKKLKHKF
jgi:hypothetical protein